MSASVIPTCEPAAEIFKAICVTSDSVVAKLFPSATIDEPSLSKFSWFIPVIFASRARAVAASSELMFVATPRFAMISVKERRFSFLIPSCPAASAIAESSDAVIGICVDIERNPVSNCSNSSSVALTVLRTPANALSNSIPLDTTDFTAPTMSLPSLFIASVARFAIMPFITVKPSLSLDA